MSCSVVMTEDSLSRGPAITARAIRSGLNTTGTPELRQDEFDRLVDVRLPASGDSGRLLAGRGEHLVPLRRDAGFRRRRDFAIARFGLRAERLEEIECGPARVAQGDLSFPLGGFLHCPILSLRLLDSQERFRFAHMGTSRENWTSQKVFVLSRYIRSASSERLCFIFISALL